MPAEPYRTAAGSMPPRWSDRCEVEPDVPDGITGIWFFNRPYEWVNGVLTGVSDAEAMRRASRNRIPGATNAQQDRVWSAVAPGIFDDCFYFGPQTYLQVRIPDSDETEFMAFVRSRDGFGLSTDRAQVIGTFGNTINRGTALRMSVNGYLIQAYDTTPTPRSLLLGTPAATLDKWRLIATDVGADDKIGIENLTGDSSQNVPTRVALTGGNFPGTQQLTIGARRGIGSANPLPETMGCDIAFVVAYNRSLVLADRPTLAAQVREWVGQTDLVEGAV